MDDSGTPDGAPAPPPPQIRWRPGHKAGRDAGRVEAFSATEIAIMLTPRAVEHLVFDPVAALVLGFVQPLLGLACHLGVVVLYFVPGAGDLPSGRNRAETRP